MVLYEKEPTCGGHTLTDDTSEFPVDLGFQVRPPALELHLRVRRAGAARSARRGAQRPDELVPASQRRPSRSPRLGVGGRTARDRAVTRAHACPAGAAAPGDAPRDRDHWPPLASPAAARSPAGRAGSLGPSAAAPPPHCPTAAPPPLQVYNLTTYPHLTGFLDALGVETEPSDMSFALSIDGGKLEWGSHDLDSVFAQRKNAASPSFLRMVADVIRFGQQAPKASGGTPAVLPGDLPASCAGRRRRALASPCLRPSCACSPAACSKSVC